MEEGGGGRERMNGRRWKRERERAKRTKRRRRVLSSVPFVVQKKIIQPVHLIFSPLHIKN